MRRLTLILSDLYLPADAVRESFPTALALPALEWLLRLATRGPRIANWRSWLAREVGAGVVADWPVAHVDALAASVPVEGNWIATPVAFEARLDHVRLRDRGLLRLPLDQQQALQVEFARSFGGMGLRAGGHPSLHLDGGPTVDIPTQDPARWLDADIGPALPPASAVSGDLRRLGAEIEMWLHSSPVNAAREKAGQRRISSLWLWGGGLARPAPPASAFAESRVSLHGTDSFVAAIHSLVGCEPWQPLPAGFEALSSKHPAVVELAPMSGDASHSLPELERNWFMPARDALSSGALESFRLVVNDQVFETAAGSGWKFWRRRRGWLESLA
jgi:hypothetical protein